MVLTDELLATCRKLYGDITCDEDLHEMRVWVGHLFDTIDALKAQKAKLVEFAKSWRPRHKKWCACIDIGKGCDCGADKYDALLKEME